MDLSDYFHQSRDKHSKAIIQWRQILTDFNHADKDKNRSNFDSDELMLEFFETTALRLMKITKAEAAAAAAAFKAQATSTPDDAGTITAKIMLENQKKKEHSYYAEMIECRKSREKFLLEYHEDAPAKQEKLRKRFEMMVRAHNLSAPEVFFLTYMMFCQEEDKKWLMIDWVLSSAVSADQRYKNHNWFIAEIRGEQFIREYGTKIFKARWPLLPMLPDRNWGVEMDIEMESLLSSTDAASLSGGSPTGFSALTIDGKPFFKEQASSIRLRAPKLFKTMKPNAQMKLEGGECMVQVHDGAVNLSFIEDYVMSTFSQHQSEIGSQ
eukprot:GILI01029270.1.p1 GENE.GILI01029270.1~~GILI01029270.1.p1  ORF type:complete len:324 (-),score=36.65 GILI01029270.1:11-982(-)